MSYSTYKIIHLIGVAALAMGLGGMMVGGSQRKLFSILQGIALFVMLVSGCGLVAKLGFRSFPHFAMAKSVIWVVIGVMPVVLRKLCAPALVGIAVSLSLVGVMAWLGVVKPALW